MKFKILLLSVLFLLTRFSVFAKPIIDSVGEKNDNGKKVILFKVKPKDTYYSIGRLFKVKPKEIMKFNNTKKETLTIGDIVKVPIGRPFKKGEKVTKETAKEKKARLAKEAKRDKEKEKSEAAQANLKSNPETANQSQSGSEPPATQYKVSAGETLYSISKRFNTSVEDITRQNNLKSNILATGQILSVRPGIPVSTPIANPNERPDSTAVKHDSIVSIPAKDSAAEKKFNASKFGLFEKDEKGVATWIDDAGLDPNKRLVLHRTAPIGAVVKITNPMTNRTTFAKVVGRFAENESTKDVIIVMTKNVADSLGALDKRFHVNISYGSPNE